MTIWARLRNRVAFRTPRQPRGAPTTCSDSAGRRWSRGLAWCEAASPSCFQAVRRPGGPACPCATRASARLGASGPYAAPRPGRLSEPPQWRTGTRRAQSRRSPQAERQGNRRPSILHSNVAVQVTAREASGRCAGEGQGLGLVKPGRFLKVREVSDEGQSLDWLIAWLLRGGESSGPWADERKGMLAEIRAPLRRRVRKNSQATFEPRPLPSSPFVTGAPCST